MEETAASMSVRADSKVKVEPDTGAVLAESAAAEAALGEGNSYCVASPARCP